jgi:hypothetical protein
MWLTVTANVEAIDCDDSAAMEAEQLSPPDSTSDTAAVDSEAPVRAGPLVSSPLLDKLRAAPLRVRCSGAGEVWYGDRLHEINDPERLLL